jgi:hypothetical protein
MKQITMSAERAKQHAPFVPVRIKRWSTSFLEGTGHPEAVRLARRSRLLVDFAVANRVVG